MPTNNWPEKKALNLSKLYQRLEYAAQNDEASRGLISLVDEVCYDAYQLKKLIIKNMGEYTLHDGTHSFNVLNHMSRLIPETCINNLKPLELAMLILSAFLHDIGMCASEEEITKWKKVIRGNLSEEETEQHSDLIAFYCSHSELWKKLKITISKGNCEQIDSIESILLSTWLRNEHAERGRQLITQLWGDKLYYRSYHFAPLLARICFSHGEDADILLTNKELSMPELVGGGEYVNSVFLAVILRLSDLLDFDDSRTPKILFDHLGIRNPVSLKEWQKHRSVEGWDIKPGYIAFSARCEHPAIEKAIRQFIVYIESELKKSDQVLSLMHLPHNIDRSQYDLQLALRVDSRIGPVEDKHGRPIYKYKDISFTLDVEKIIQLLMGSSLYGRSEIALRELLQNAIDTCRLRAIKEKGWERTYKPEIEVSLYHSKIGCDILEVSDNGMGMDVSIIENYFSSIGKSYYSSSELQYELKDIEYIFNPISKFGIGFLSLFMLADEISVETCRLIGSHSLAKPIEIKITGGETGLFWFLDGKKQGPGTKIILYLKDNHPFRFSRKIPVKNEDELIEKSYLRTPYDLRHIISSMVPHCEIPIIIKGLKGDLLVEENVFDQFLSYEVEDSLNLSKTVAERVDSISITLANYKDGLITLNEEIGGVLSLLPHFPILIPSEKLASFSPSGKHHLTLTARSLYGENNTFNDAALEFVRLQLDEPDGLRGILVCLLLKTMNPSEGYANRVISSQTGPNNNHIQPRLCLQVNEIAFYKSEDAENNNFATSRMLTYGKLSINGVSVADNIFYDPTLHAYFNNELLKWPFPIYFYDIDLSGVWGLNLTVSRDKIILDDRFTLFKQRFAEVISQALVKKISAKSKAEELIKALNESTGNRFGREKDEHILLSLQKAADKLE